MLVSAISAKQRKLIFLGNEGFRLHLLELLLQVMNFLSHLSFFTAIWFIDCSLLPLDGVSWTIEITMETNVWILLDLYWLSYLEGRLLYVFVGYGNAQSNSLIMPDGCMNA